MDLITEYQNQEKWRHWEAYLKHIPLGKDQVVLDLGCSIGAVSHLLAEKVGHVIGVDRNQAFIDYATRHKQPNQTFIAGDIVSEDYSRHAPISGIWSSFAFSYLAKPQAFITHLFDLLPVGSWLALVEISCFISGNMNPRSPYLEEVRRFEVESCHSGKYDFDFGAKMEGFVKEAGFQVSYIDNDVLDRELNFNGKAQGDVLKNWEARMARMQGLQSQLGERYEAFRMEFLAHISSTSHTKNGTVRFVVGIKV